MIQGPAQHRPFFYREDTLNTHRKRQLLNNVTAYMFLSPALIGIIAIRDAVQPKRLSQAKSVEKNCLRKPNSDHSAVDPKNWTM